jgi:MFS transporter, DHA2 family, multidrug resistance protein
MDDGRLHARVGDRDPADRFGAKRLFIGSVLAFTAGSLLCATAPNIALLIAFRVIQGLGGGMLLPLAFTILAREAGPKRVGRLMAVLGIPVMLCPMAGPILGGWIIDNYSWRWIFLINLPIGMAACVLAVLVLPRSPAIRSEKFDLVGMLLLPPVWRRCSMGFRRSRPAARSSTTAYGYRRPQAWR